MRKPLRKIPTVYILWNPASDLPPRVRFYTAKEATDAAKVMARQYPGHTFHVCRVLDGWRTTYPLPIEMIPPKGYADE